MNALMLGAVADKYWGSHQQYIQQDAFTHLGEHESDVDGLEVLKGILEGC